MGATHFLMKTLPRVASEMALHVLAYNLTRVSRKPTLGSSAISDVMGQKRKSPKLREAASIASVVSGTDRRVMPFIAGGNSGAIA